MGQTLETKVQLCRKAVWNIAVCLYVTAPRGTRPQTALLILMKMSFTGSQAYLAALVRVTEQLFIEFIFRFVTHRV